MQYSFMEDSDLELNTYLVGLMAEFCPFLYMKKKNNSS